MARSSSRQTDRVEPDVDEARARPPRRFRPRPARQPRRDQLRQSARIGARPLGQHHRRVGREVAMRRIARRLDRHRLALEAGRELALALQRVEDVVDMRGKAGVEGHVRLPYPFGRRRGLAERGARIEARASGCRPQPAAYRRDCGGRSFQASRRFGQRRDRRRHDAPRRSPRSGRGGRAGQDSPAG